MIQQDFQHNPQRAERLQGPPPIEAFSGESLFERIAPDFRMSAGSSGSSGPQPDKGPGHDPAKPSAPEKDPVEAAIGTEQKMVKAGWGLVALNYAVGMAYWAGGFGVSIGMPVINLADSFFCYFGAKWAARRLYSLQEGMANDDAGSVDASVRRTGSTLDAVLCALCIYDTYSYAATLIHALNTGEYAGALPLGCSALSKAYLAYTFFRELTKGRLNSSQGESS